MVLIKFGSYTPPTPTKYEIDCEDIDGSSTGRGETGKMERERVREGVYKISLEFTNITSTDLLNIKNAIKQEKISVQFFEGNMVSAEMYSGSRKISLKSIDGESNAFWNMSFNLTEF